jgi:hypothetical protein
MTDADYVRASKINNALGSFVDEHNAVLENIAKRIEIDETALAAERAKVARFRLWLKEMPDYGFDFDGPIMRWYEAHPSLDDEESK